MNVHWRLIGWFIWSNAITILQAIQTAITSLMLYAGVFSPKVFQTLVIANAVLSGIIAQVKRNNPPGPRPERDNDSDPS